jgi:hypothetical protein
MRSGFQVCTTVAYTEATSLDWKSQCLANPSVSHRNQTISRRWAYILADIHSMEHFCTKLAPRPYNKPRSCVSKIHTPMVMIWFGNV